MNSGEEKKIPVSYGHTFGVPGSFQARSSHIGGLVPRITVLDPADPIEMSNLVTN
jgi:hypothetical protein